MRKTATAIDDTKLDWSDDIAEISALQWARDTGRSTSPQFYMDDPDFLDPDSDITESHFDIVFSRPAPPDSPVELWCLDGDEPSVLGVFKSLALANDVAFCHGGGSFGVKVIN